MDKNGPGEFVNHMITKQFNLKKPVVIGYDWGAAIALKMGINDKQIFSKIIAFHPSFSDTDNELKNLQIPTLI